MIFTVTDLTENQQSNLIEEVVHWKDNTNLAYPRIYSATPKEGKVEIDFQDGDAVKVAGLIRKLGYRFT